MTTIKNAVVTGRLKPLLIIVQPPNRIFPLAWMEHVLRMIVLFEMPFSLLFTIIQKIICRIAENKCKPYSVVSKLLGNFSFSAQRTQPSIGQILAERDPTLYYYCLFCFLFLLSLLSYVYVYHWCSLVLDV